MLDLLAGPFQATVIRGCPEPHPRLVIHGGGRNLIGSIRGAVVAGLEVNGAVTAAYRKKYDRYGPSIVGTVVWNYCEGVALRLPSMSTPAVSTASVVGWTSPISESASTFTAWMPTWQGEREGPWTQGPSLSATAGTYGRA